MWNYQIVSWALPHLNSVTKYPSIPTYHQMGEKGRLSNRLTVSFDEDVYIQEKCDGTNGRIVFTPFGYFIGSREEFLFYEHDILFNPANGIVNVLRPIAEKLKFQFKGDKIVVTYFEVYGGKIGSNAKEYSGYGNFGAVLFDIMSIKMDMFGELCKKSLDEISGWRENSGQNFLPIGPYSFDGICDVPLIRMANGNELPKTIDGMYSFLKSVIPSSLCALDDGARRNPEGIIIRTSDRSKIVKVRYEDYIRTLRKA